MLRVPERRDRLSDLKKAAKRLGLRAGKWVFDAFRHVFRWFLHGFSVLIDGLELE